MNDYIMNRESLKRHCEAMCKKFKDVPTSGTYGEHRLVLDLLKQTEWIPVNESSERLPESDGYYLVTEKSGRVCTYVFHKEGNSEEYWKRCIVAWMPLPEPYEPQEVHCNCTDKEIAKSFIEDVEAVKDLLPMAESEG